MTDRLQQPDVQASLARVKGSDLFRPGAPITVSRAPGRLDVMGGIADYSGSLVLELPIREATFAALQRDEEPVLRIVSLGGEGNGRSAEFLMPMANFPSTYEDARAYFASDPRHAWAAYAAGTFFVLMQEKGSRFEGGARILIASDVPEGKGVSSSAAIEVAVMQAVCGAYDVPLEPRELAILCQMVENRVVGAPCGVMDQMTSAAGQTDHLLALLCQPAEVQGNVPIPEGMEFWGIDSGVRHSVSGADYGSVRVGAFMGHRIIAATHGLQATAENGLARFEFMGRHFYLANIAPSEFEVHFGRYLPEKITGSEFLARYGGTTDPVTRVDPDRTYAVRIPTAHPVYENFRVRTFAALLSSPDASSGGEERMKLLGELMYQSHASYSACGLGSEATDKLMAMVWEAGSARGLYGAKITGGGSGGTVAVLARSGADAAIHEIADQYARETGRQPYIFHSSSPGAAAFGTLTINREDLT